MAKYDSIRHHHFCCCISTAFDDCITVLYFWWATTTIPFYSSLSRLPGSAISLCQSLPACKNTGAFYFLQSLLWIDMLLPLLAVMEMQTMHTALQASLGRERWKHTRSECVCVRVRGERGQYLGQKMALYSVLRQYARTSWGLCVCYDSSRNVHQSMRWAAAVGTSRSLCLPVLSFLSVSCPLPESKSEILGSAAAADGGKWHESIELFFFFFFHVTKVFWCCCHCCPFIRLTRAMFYLVILPPVALLFSHESFRICAHPLIQKQRQQKLASAGAFLFTSLLSFHLLFGFDFCPQLLVNSIAAAAVAVVVIARLPGTSFIFSPLLLLLLMTHVAVAVYCFTGFTLLPLCCLFVDCSNLNLIRALSSTTLPYLYTAQMRNRWWWWWWCWCWWWRCRRWADQSINWTAAADALVDQASLVGCRAAPAAAWASCDCHYIFISSIRCICMPARWYQHTKLSLPALELAAAANLVCSLSATAQWSSFLSCQFAPFVFLTCSLCASILSRSGNFVYIV